MKKRAKSSFSIMHNTFYNIFIPIYIYKKKLGQFSRKKKRILLFADIWSANIWLNVYCK